MNSFSSKYKSRLLGLLCPQTSIITVRQKGRRLSSFPLTPFSDCLMLMDIPLTQGGRQADGVFAQHKWRSAPDLYSAETRQDDVWFGLRLCMARHLHIPLNLAHTLTPQLCMLWTSRAGLRSAPSVSSEQERASHCFFLFSSLCVEQHKH